MNSKMELNFQKNNIGLGKENKQLQGFFLFQVKEILLLIRNLVINIYNIMILI
jgi:hypothetical protein